MTPWGHHANMHTCYTVCHKYLPGNKAFLPSSSGKGNGTSDCTTLYSWEASGNTWESYNIKVSQGHTGIKVILHQGDTGIKVTLHQGDTGIKVILASRWYCHQGHTASRSYCIKVILVYETGIWLNPQVILLLFTVLWGEEELIILSDVGCLRDINTSHTLWASDVTISGQITEWVVRGLWS